MISGLSGRGAGTALIGAWRDCAGTARCGTSWRGALADDGGVVAAGGRVAVEGAGTACAGAFCTGGSGELVTVGGRAAVAGIALAGGAGTAVTGGIVVDAAGGKYVAGGE